MSTLCVIKECLHRPEAEVDNCILACRSGGLRARQAGELRTAREQALEPFRRQMDPLQSCIEARCSNSRQPYRHCIYAHCIADLSLGRKYKRQKEGDPSPWSKRSGEQDEDNQISDLIGSRSEPSPSATWKNVLLRKRGVNDFTDVCIEYHCPRETPGTLTYLTCIRDNKCMGR